MFRHIFQFELKRLFRQAATYIYFVVFFAAAILTMLGTATSSDKLADGAAIRLINSAYELHQMLHYFNKFCLFLLPAIIGRVVYQDFSSRIYSILYAYPIKISAYLLGKFLSGLATVLFISLALGLAFLLGEKILGLEHPMMGPTNYGGYISAYVFFIWPNIVFYGLIVFVVVTTLRNIYAGFLVVILLFFLQFILENLLPGHPFLLALFDPFAQHAAAVETRYWTLAEQNSRQLPVLGVVLWNRMIWTTISLGVLGLFYKKFQLEQFPSTILYNGLRSRKPSGKIAAESRPIAGHRTAVRIELAFRYQLAAMWKLSGFELRYVISSRMFYVLLLFAIAALVFALGKVTHGAEMAFLPLSRIMLSVPQFFFSTVIILLTFIYAGMLVHRSGMARMNHLIDVTFTPSWALLGSKVVALWAMQALLLLVMLFCGLGLQVYHAYYHFELGLYLFHLFVLVFPVLMIWAVMAVFIHSLLPNLYLGIFLLLLIWLGKDQLMQIGLESRLLAFNSPQQLLYSDLNGFGYGLSAYLVMNAYWFAFSGMLLVVAYLCWQRGLVFSVRGRIEVASARFGGKARYIMAGYLVLSCCLGFIIYREENDPLAKTGNDRQLLEQAQLAFGKYQHHLPPKIVRVNLDIALSPEDQSFRAKGRYVLVNKTGRQLDTLLIKTGFDEITTYSISATNRTIDQDSRLQFAVHQLDKPLLPGDSLYMEFEIQNKANRLFQQNSPVLRNGTFLRTDILPRLGYFWNDSLIDPADTLAGRLSLYSRDADLVDVETIISTSAKQSAIAPGYLQKQWSEQGRNYFHYKTGQKVKFLFAFNSGVFSIEKTSYRGVDLEIYHHKTHDQNLREMLAGLRAAIDYNTYYFEAYPERVVRIVEFPLSEGTFATLMNTSIPASEVRFVLKNTDVDERIKMSFYVQAHELTHQWWGNQLIPADVLGAKMLTESITEYLSLKIYEKHFGREKAQHFLGLQRQRYLHGRARESGRESPLNLVKPEQEYIAYGKGTMALNTLSYYLGEEQLNGILRSFLEQYRGRTDQYPTSLDLIDHLKKHTPPSYHFVIEDMMEAVTVYDNQITAVELLPGQQLAITIQIKQLDSATGKELKPAGVLIELGQLDAAGRLLASGQHGVTSGKNNLTITPLPGMKSIVLDPHLLLIDVDLENNQWSIE